MTAMTLADFYTGRGTNATYLGTARYLAEPVHPGVFQSLTSDEFGGTDFGRIVRAMCDTSQWPHVWADSSDTPWTYCYEKGSVYVYRYGVEMLVIRCNTHRSDRSHGRPAGREWRPVNDFPAMTPERTTA